MLNQTIFRIKLENKLIDTRDQISDLKFMKDQEFPRRIKQLEDKAEAFTEQLLQLEEEKN